jgi:macrodomain Ter protein organizer (MatP/YcbG family)
MEKETLENEKFKTKKATFQLTNDSLHKLDSLSTRIGITKSKIIDILIKKMETNTIKDEFDLYNITCKKHN